MGIEGSSISGYQDPTLLNAGKRLEDDDVIIRDNTILLYSTQTILTISLVRV